MNPEQKKTIEFLERYRFYFRSANALREEFEEQTQQFEPLKELTLLLQKSEESKGEFKKIETGINKIVTQEKKARIKAETIKSVINAVPEEEGELLKLRYIEGKTWDSIANALYYSQATIHNMHRRALNKAAKIINAEGIDIEAYIKKSN